MHVGMSRAPTHAAPACARAMQAQSTKLMLPSCRACSGAGPNAATTVAGKPTIYPTAAARPTLLCIGMPERLMTILVRMPPPTPANPDTAPIRNPEKSRPTPTGGCGKTGPKAPRSGESCGREQAKTGEHRDQEGTPQVGGRELRKDAFPHDARPPFPKERRVGIARAPVDDRRCECRREDCCQ